MGRRSLIKCPNPLSHLVIDNCRLEKSPELPRNEGYKGGDIARHSVGLVNGNIPHWSYGCLELTTGEETTEEKLKGHEG